MSDHHEPTERYWDAVICRAQRLDPSAWRTNYTGERKFLCVLAEAQEREHRAARGEWMPERALQEELR